MAKNNHLKPAVLIFAKAPIPGYCKTRMQSDLSAQQCAGLQDALFSDVMALEKELQEEMDVEFWVAYDPDDFTDYFLTFTSRLFLQEGKDLGQRICHGLQHLFKQGYGPIVILGSDTPLLKEDLLIAFQKLDQAALVIGPTLDGGYYLLGLHEYTPLLFTDIPWSTSDVLQQTCKKAEQLQMAVLLLDSKRDIDYFNDLIAYRHIQTNRAFDTWKQLFFNKRSNLSD